MRVGVRGGWKLLWALCRRPPLLVSWLSVRVRHVTRFLNAVGWLLEVRWQLLIPSLRRCGAACCAVRCVQEVDRLRGRAQGQPLKPAEPGSGSIRADGVSISRGTSDAQQQQGGLDGLAAIGRGGRG